MKLLANQRTGGNARELGSRWRKLPRRGLSPVASVDGCRVYLITPPVLDPVPFAGLLAAALDAGDVAAVQLRLKDVDDDTWRRAVDALRPVCQSRDGAFLLHTRA